ncbi:hypothetical protein [Micromonospora sp. SH-82]|uniref:hypothetical protein n=1 Tax=Micromonospora sp. SH-82 TaxID=3132938 RepID=UPI003EB89916
MADGQVWLDPGRARRGGRDLGLAGAAVTARQRQAGGRIAAASAQRPWGRDDIGAAFERGYRGYEETVLRVWAGLGHRIEGLGDEVLRAVDADLRTDTASGKRLDRVTDQRR